MSSSNISQKKLKAIVFTDIADFTKISARDEKQALDLIDKQKKIIKPIVEKHNGDWLKEIGDGLLFSFDSSLDAVNCSIKIQESLKKVNDLNIRIGIHQGDIFIKDGDVFGDDVNIASRIESFAPIGGVALSDKVKKDIQSVSKIKTDFIGHRKLKGVQQETKISCITSNDLPKNKDNLVPKVIAYSNLFIGYQFFIRALLSSGLLLFKVISDTEITLEFYESIITYYKQSIIFLLIGYSCLSFYKGISIKSQKAIYYFGIFNALYFLIVKVFKQFIEYLMTLPNLLSKTKLSWIEKLKSLESTMGQTEFNLAKQHDKDFSWMANNPEQAAIFIIGISAIMLLITIWIFPALLMNLTRYIIDLLKLKRIIK